VSLNAEGLLHRLADLERLAGRPTRFVVAFSGGLDSTVLLHAIAAGRERHGLPVLAIHIDHGLQAESSQWAERCERFAAGLAVPFASESVSVDLDAGLGPEAAAREARYAALRQFVSGGDWLLSAHHLDDQAETVLLNLMRGSGTSGLAGIGPVRRIASGWLVRPLLDVPRADLEAYAEAHALSFIDDPSNLEQQFDRNYLRQEILPRFEARWPDAAARIRRSAQLAREATGLLAELAELDRLRCADRADRLSLAELRELSPERQRNLLRYVIGQLGLPSPGARHLEQIVTGLVPAREDAQPLVSWPGARARRYRDRLYFSPSGGEDEGPPPACAVSGNEVPLPAGMGSLVLRAGAKQGLSAEVLRKGLEVRYRVGGEEFMPAGQTHTRKLKKLLQEAAIVPWMRERLPLLYSGDRLVAVADLWMAADAVSEPGTAVEWRNRPALH
jgi:tRNA(Ile)-lysidine synthase